MRLAGQRASYPLYDHLRVIPARNLLAIYAWQLVYRVPPAVKFAAAYNPMSSFRLLQSDATAQLHLRRVAEALQPSGFEL